MGYREYTIRTKYEVTTVPSLDDPKHVFYWSEKPEDIIIKDLTSDGASAGAKVLMSREYPDFSPKPIWVDVSFSNTNSGWRISGGSYVYALTDWENADLKYEVAYRHFPNAFTIRAIIASVYLKKIVSIEEILQDSQSVLPDNYFDSGKAVVRWEVLSINDNRFELLVEFAEGNNSENHPPQYVFEPSGKNRTYNAVFTRNNDGKFVLTDGGVYELANGKTDVAPATGDDNLSRIYALAAVAALSAMICAAAVTVRRRKVS
ncbi:MAG: hypothetical protein J6V01_00590 [Clostridia bacterium]|nr:hypothetical protein [Clostridia bacterium]